VATALEAFRRERGSYLESKSAADLIDHLNPRFLGASFASTRGISLMAMKGTRTSFVLRSAGADEKPNTADDVIVSR
jgi:hypothetical protein